MPLTPEEPAGQGSRPASGSFTIQTGGTAGVPAGVPANAAAGALPKRAQRKPGKRAHLRWPIEFLLILVGAALIALVLRLFVVQVYQIPSESMTDTLQVGSRIAVNRVPGWGKQVERGDVIVFQDTQGWLQGESGEPGRFGGLWQALGFVPSGGQQMVVKRVVGVGGDTVACCDDQGRLTVNGEPVDEPYVLEGTVPSDVEFEITVPEGTYWVMGDNRDNSADSRYHWENGGNPFVPRDAVVGRAEWQIWPLSNWARLGDRNVFELVEDGF